MRLQSTENNEQLQILVAEAKKSKEAFFQLQEKANEIKNNIARNKKIVEALQNENIELQKKSEELLISDTGEINLSQLDSYSQNIFLNERKIKALEQTINKFEKELELFILEKCQHSYKESIIKISKAYDYYSLNKLDEFIDKNKEDLNIILFFLKESRTHNKEDALSIILNTIKNKLENEKTKHNNSSELPLPTPQFYGYSNISTIYSTQRIKELKEILGK